VSLADAPKSIPPAPGYEAPPPPPPGWRKRHPVLARVVLYGAFLAVLGGILGWALWYRQGSAQAGLLTKLQGLNDSGTVLAAPADTLKVIREEILPKATDDDVVRRAHLLEATALDGLKRYDEADAVYQAVADALPATILKGAVYVPWANMRISAGRPADALKLLDAPDATAGWPKEGAVGFVAIRARAQRVLEGKESPQGPSKAPPK